MRTALPWSKSTSCCLTSPDWADDTCCDSASVWRPEKKHLWTMGGKTRNVWKMTPTVGDKLAVPPLLLFIVVKWWRQGLELQGPSMFHHFIHRYMQTRISRKTGIVQWGGEKNLQTAPRLSLHRMPDQMHVPVHGTTKVYLSMEQRCTCPWNNEDVPVHGTKVYLSMEQRRCTCPWNNEGVPVHGTMKVLSKKKSVFF